MFSRQTADENSIRGICRIAFEADISDMERGLQDFSKDPESLEMLRMSAARTAEAAAGLATMYSETQEMADTEGVDPVRAVSAGNRYKVRRRLIVVIAAILALVFATTVIDGNFRKLKLSEIRVVKGASAIYDFEDGETSVAEDFALPDLEIQWMPEGFELNRSDDFINITSHRLYKNKDTGDGINISIMALDADLWISFQSMTISALEIKEVTINGLDADLIPHDGKSCNIIWIDEALRVIVTMETSLLEEDLLKMAESVYW